jgi:hypothetical protein
VALDVLVVNREDIVQRTSFSLTWLRLATSSSARFGGRQPYLNVRKTLYVIGAFAVPQGAFGVFAVRSTSRIGDHRVIPQQSKQGQNVRTCSRGALLSQPARPAR